MTQRHPLRQLEELEYKCESPSQNTGGSRWMIPYVDMITLVLGLFILMSAVIIMDNVKLAEANAKVEQALQTERQRSVSFAHAIEDLNQALETSQSEKIEKDLDKVPLELNSKPTTLESLETTLLSQLGLEEQQVSVRQEEHGLVISFQERIFFAPGQASLSSQSQKTLDKLTKILKQTDRPIRIEGHTDNTPIHTQQYPSNWELSTARATSIIRQLVDKYHFPPERLSAGGYGEFKPITDNSTIEGKQKNRRVDIVLLDRFPTTTKSDALAEEVSTVNPLSNPSLLKEQP